MWPDLYRCSVYAAWLSFCVAISANVTVGQGSIAAPAPEVDPDPPRPYLAPLLKDAKRSPITPGTLDRLHSPLLRGDLKINGAQSCATSNCHAGPQPGVGQPSARRGMEYQLWIESDPHAQSWRTMCSDESVAIMQRLKIMEGDVIVDQVGFDNCLACHNTTKRYNEPRSTHGQHTSSLSSLSDPSGVNSFLREGVGCAGCHGPSQQWISHHFQYAWSPLGATSQGFVEAGDLYVRARLCASCHVGDKDRDMNHDIIAAGHPTLRYELATFHAWQPKHWRDTEANDAARYEAQLWLAGQIAATDASLALLNSRATGNLSVSQWPEFAAYDCASCHHNLGLDNARRPIDEGRKATANHSQWNDAGIRWFINDRIETGAAGQQDLDLMSALERVQQRMEAQPSPSADEVAQASAHARQVLAAWFDSAALIRERVMFDSDRLASVVASAAGKRDTFDSWESAVQFYLAAVAARESWPGGWHGPPRNVADRMQKGLGYPEMIDISRYAKRPGSGPQLNQNQAMQLGIELAGWLGPVHPEMMDADDEPQITDTMRDQLRQMIERINQRWKEQADAAPGIDEGNDPGNDPERVEPKRVLKTREELLEELRQRSDTSNDDRP